MDHVSDRWMVEDELIRKDDGRIIKGWINDGSIVKYKKES